MPSLTEYSAIESRNASELHVIESNVLVVCVASPNGLLIHERSMNAEFSPGRMDLISGPVDDFTFYNPEKLAREGRGFLNSVGLDTKPSEHPIGTSRNIKRYVTADEGSHVRATNRVFLRAAIEKPVDAPSGYRWIDPGVIRAFGGRWRHRSEEKALEILSGTSIVGSFSDTTVGPDDEELAAYSRSHPWSWEKEVAVHETVFV